MAVAALSIKLRCASWQQLATIYRRDLSKGSMFLKASSQPPLGTLVRIDLELPSATVIELSGVIVKHVVDAQRGSGVDLKLEPLPTKSVWMIESALAADSKVRAQTAGAAPGGVPVATGDAPSAEGTRALSEGQDIAEAETDLVKALEAECGSLRKLNPFLVLGVTYETTDEAVRGAFGELTKRYHPDRFARYQSAQLRQVAAEIFILIRDAYRKLADPEGRQAALAQIHKPPVRTGSQPRLPTPPVSRPGAIQRIPTPPPVPMPGVHDSPTKPRPEGYDKGGLEPPTKPGPYDAPTNPSAKTAELANTDLAKGDDLAAIEREAKAPAVIAISPDGPKRLVDANSAPAAKTGPLRTITDAKSGPVRMPPMPPRIVTPATGVPIVPAPPPASAGAHDALDVGTLETLIDVGKVDDALAGYRALAAKHPNDRSYRAGVELCEGMHALAQRDRMEAAQRFEAALELDPSNERAARELAEMRRQATNERKGLLSRLMGKKEPT